jgi:hypothetical protein
VNPCLLLSISLFLRFYVFVYFGTDRVPPDFLVSSQNAVPTTLLEFL